MPRYYLNIRDPEGGLIVDPEGDEADDLAQIEALAREIVKDILSRPETYGGGEIWKRRCIEITDSSEKTVLVVPFGEKATDGGGETI